MDDSTRTTIPADFLCRGLSPRDPAPLEARLGEQFLKQNHDAFLALGVAPRLRYDGSRVEIEFTTGTIVGAIPLRAPTSGRFELGLIVKPRYEWRGLGGMLGQMGWKIIPSPLPIPNLPRSERKVPPWVLSAIVLGRIQLLIKNLRREFEMTTSIRTAPHGSVDWQSYATQHVSRGDFLAVPCRHPNLTLDQSLQAAIHFTLRRHFASLESQRQAGQFVIGLIRWCRDLLDRVSAVPPQVPTGQQMRLWMNGALRLTAVREGLDAIAWTVDERGLAGVCDMHGLAWSMPMESFFEAWTESILRAVAVRVGGVVRAGRLRETAVPIEWDPPYFGSQRFLLPDLVMETPNGTVIMDAKYKDHWEDLSFNRWGELAEAIRDRHRADVLQVLAYAGVLEAGRPIACLIYPCRTRTWESLNERGRLFHRASIGVGSRTVTLLLAAAPMDASMERVVDRIADELRRNLVA